MSLRVIVVGGGAAGLAAAGRAAELGADVIVLEKGPRLGRKLLLTGNGHCNLTNHCPPTEFYGHLGPTGEFMRNAIARWGSKDLIEFMQHLGVPTITNSDGRVFPSSYSSNDVLTALVNYNMRHGVTFSNNCAVEALHVRNGVINRVITRGAQHEFPADAVIMATGGKSWAQTGSSGDGYTILEHLGHRIVKPLPGLVPVIVAESWVKSLEGIALQRVNISTASGSRHQVKSEGEVLFTSDGLSGPATLNHSSRIAADIAAGQVQLNMDLFPGIAADTLGTQLPTETETVGNTEFATILQSHLPHRLAQAVINLAWQQEADRAFKDIQHIPAKQVTIKQKRNLIELCKNLPLTILATQGFSKAMITVGGVCCDQVDPISFASKLVKNLYIVGELLDVAGDTGGYNLQVAFTSGRLAGGAASRMTSTWL